MKLTQENIQNLYKFTRKHYVYHYDVQTELVDHLANDIEQIWEESPKLSFEKARDTSFKKFGIFGFMDVIEAKQKQMNKRYRKIMWRFFKEWYTMPKIITTLTLVLGLFCLLQIPFSQYILLGVLFILVVIDLRNLYIRRKEQQKQQKKDKVFLLEAMIGDTRNGFSGIMFINSFNLVNAFKTDFSQLENHIILLISFVAVAISILFYVTGFLMPQKAQELLEETYPEYKMVNSL
ncbi:hypothetical protein LPB136_11565 [Tenacibaculum todarodis]|uniref:Uncharacterized protein n=1 Tax=Tenacibaculum todarodis TaxID=1850252 RepID=A0A1L3JLG7_9FLAO|nr:hypothetical protein [Tenacibaculum todarodis]APG65961.1 hypothetical protein LPB136_11565 [Tenacibaculum todarodis]